MNTLIRSFNLRISSLPVNYHCYICFQLRYFNLFLFFSWQLCPKDVTWLCVAQTHEPCLWSGCPVPHWNCYVQFLVLFKSPQGANQINRLTPLISHRAFLLRMSHCDVILSYFCSRQTSKKVTCTPCRVKSRNFLDPPRPERWEWKRATRHMRSPGFNQSQSR